MLTVRGLHHQFDGRSVLEQIDLDLGAGQIQVLMGPNGAGKTTLLRLLSGILPVQSGTLQFAGAAVNDDPGRRRMRTQVGLLTEAPGLYESMSVRENLRLFGRLHGLGAAECEARIELQAAQFRITDRLDQRAGRLSKGLKQRVALIRAVLHGPHLLLLDEPTSGLDPAAAADLHEWIARMCAAGLAVLLATHDLAEATLLSSNIRVLNRRCVDLPVLPSQLLVQIADAPSWATRLRLQGWTVRVNREGRIGELALDAPDMEATAEMLRHLVQAGARVYGATQRSDAALQRYRAALAQIASTT